MSSSTIPVIPQVELDMPQASWGVWIGKIARLLNQMLGGKLNATTSVTLTANDTTTTLTDSRIGYTSFVAWSPTTLNASLALVGANPMFVTVTQGSATFTHANTADVDKTFTILIIG